MIRERSFNNRVVDGDRALEIVNRHRASVKDNSVIMELGRELPRFAQYLGSGALYIANVADNEAGAFKWRGAAVGAEQLYEQGVRSIVVPSAGNALRGSVLAARALGMNIHGVVPTTAPRVKKEGARELWDDPRFQLHTEGESFNQSLTWAHNHPELGVILHPFDDPNVVRGQGTIMDDIVALGGDEIKHIVTEIGGGGLLEGLIQRRDELGRDVVIHAVQAQGSDSLGRSLQNDRLTPATAPNPRYGGSAVSIVSESAFQAASDAKNFELYTVSDEEVDYLIGDYEADRAELDRETTPNFEPTTLVAMAGLRQVIQAYPNEGVVVIGSGYNDTLRPHVPASRSAFTTWR
ncbi:MAG TPA: pyridoxal-phosphate dependent enzyme [Candidatus Saccharimonadales bacterium]|nr:pyridoxal-phosphate dependent enzyme [Candidatus Saccharimonadales bacterium]